MFLLLTLNKYVLAGDTHTWDNCRHTSFKGYHRNTKNISRNAKIKNTSQEYLTFDCFYQWCEHQITKFSEATGNCNRQYIELKSHKSNL